MKALSKGGLSDIQDKVGKEAKREKHETELGWHDNSAVNGGVT